MRQLTKGSELGFDGEFSKLPMRQLTNGKVVYSSAKISKLPMRQLTKELSGNIGINFF